MQMPEPWAFWILPNPTLSTWTEEGLCGGKVIPHIAQLGILWLPGGRTWAACPNSLNPGSRFIIPRIPELFSAPHLGSSRNSSPIPSLFACLSVQFL